jgi:hypothetical protein
MFEDQIMVNKVSEESTFWMICWNDDELASTVTDCIYTGHQKLNRKTKFICRILEGQLEAYPHEIVEVH